MKSVGIKEYFVPQHQRVGNTKINSYTHDQYQQEKKLIEKMRLERAATERVKQARLSNNDLGQNIDIYC